ncbi:MAG: ABC transporter substrate-binding protein [Rhizobiaceae bacterium]
MTGILEKTGKFIGVLAFAASLALTTAIVEAKSLRTNIGADAKTLNPIPNSELISGNIISQMYETLTALDVNGKVVPGLAVKWEGAADGKSFKFWLREGVNFHSGRTMTAADVKWTFEQVLTPAKKGGLMVDSINRIVGAKDMLDGKATTLSGFKIIDDLTFEISFTAPSVIFPLYELFVVDSGIEKEHGEDWSQKVSGGTGPFKYSEWKRGVSVDIAAHAGYWNGAAQIDGVSFLVVPNIETALTMYEAGELDLVSIPRSSVRNVKKDPRFAGQLMEKPAAQVAYLGMNQNLYAPFKDIRVREAMAISVDRDAMVKGLYGGAAFPAYGQIAPAFPGYDASTPAIPYDVAKAKKLMSEAGFPDGKGLPPLTIQGTPRDKTLLAFYANNYKKNLGMDITVKVVERGTHIKGMNGGKVPFFPWGWTADYADPATFLSDLYYSKSKWNRVRYSNPAFDALMDKALETADDTKRFALYNQADRVLINDYGTIPTTVRMQIGVIKPTVKNVHLTPMGYMPFWDVTID